jgi:hypothetical protein
MRRMFPNFGLGIAMMAMSAVATMTPMDTSKFLPSAPPLPKQKRRRARGGSTGQSHRINWGHRPHQGSRECCRRQAQVAKLAARGRDWTGKELAHG